MFKQEKKNQSSIVESTALKGVLINWKVWRNKSTIWSWFMINHKILIAYEELENLIPFRMGVLNKITN
jgi:hypothetical protein